MHVSLISVVTLDGRQAGAWLKTEENRFYVKAIRHATDASLIGYGRLARDRVRMLETGGGRRSRRIRAVVSHDGLVDADLPLFDGNGDRPWVLVPAPVAALAGDRLGDRARVAGLKPGADGRLAPRVLLDFLTDRGAKSVLVEGGGQLNGAFLGADLVDELHLTVTAAFAGQDPKAVCWVDPAFLARGAAPRFKLVQCTPSVRWLDIYCRFQRIGRETGRETDSGPGGHDETGQGP